MLNHKKNIPIFQICFYKIIKNVKNQHFLLKTIWLPTANQMMLTNTKKKH